MLIKIIFNLQILAICFNLTFGSLIPGSSFHRNDSILEDSLKVQFTKNSQFMKKGEEVSINATIMLKDDPHRMMTNVTVGVDLMNFTSIKTYYKDKEVFPRGDGSGISENIISGEAYKVEFAGGVLSKLVTPLSEAKLKIIAAENDAYRIQGMVIRPLEIYVQPPTITSNATDHQVTLQDGIAVIEIEIRDLEGSFPLTVELTSIGNDTEDIRLHLLNGENDASSGFIRTTMSLPYSEEEPTKETLTVLVNATQVKTNESEVAIGHVALGLIFGEEGAVLHVVKILSQKVEEETHAWKNVSADDWLEVFWFNVIDGSTEYSNMIFKDQSFKIEAIAHVSSSMLNEKFSLNVRWEYEQSGYVEDLNIFTDKMIGYEGKSFTFQGKIKQTVLPLEKVEFIFTLKNGFGVEVFNEVSQYLYGGTPSVEFIILNDKIYSPGDTVDFRVKIDMKGIKVSNNTRIQVLYPHENGEVYLKYRPNPTAFKSSNNGHVGSTTSSESSFAGTSETDKHNILLIDIPWYPRKEHEITQVRLSTTVVDHPSLIGRSTQKVFVGVIVGPHMVYFDHVNVTLNKDVTGKKADLHMDITSQSIVADDVEINININHKSPESLTIMNPVIVLYKVPFIEYRASEIKSNMTYRNRIAHEWKFDGTFLPTDTISIKQSGKVIHKMLLSAGLNNLYVLAIITFKNATGHSVQFERAAELTLFKPAPIYVKHNPRKKQEYYGRGVFVLENADEFTIYVCKNQHAKFIDTACWKSMDFGKNWEEMDLQIGCVVGYDKQNKLLYGVSRNQQYFLYYDEHTGESMAVSELPDGISRQTINLEKANHIYAKDVPVDQIKEFQDKHQLTGTSEGVFYKDKRANGWERKFKW